jgi:hypothetical protein
MPYGGVKDSGAGREGPRCATEELTVTRMAVIRPSDKEDLTMPGPRITTRVAQNFGYHATLCAGPPSDVELRMRASGHLFARASRTCW